MTPNKLKKLFTNPVLKSEPTRQNIILFFIIGLASMLVSFLFIRKIQYYFGDKIEISLIILAALIIYLRFKFLSSIFKTICIGFLLIVSFFSVQSSTNTIKSNFSHPHEWDFLCFYMDGNVAGRGLNFYEPKNYAKVYKEINIPFTPSEDFVKETINVGFQYYPPNIFLFIPLKFFDFKTAQIVWDISILIFLVLDFYILLKFILKDESLVGILTLIPLLLLMEGTMKTLHYEHNTFIFLLPVLLFWKDKDKSISGLWLALAIFLKPIFLILIIFPILKKNRSAILTTITAGTVICLITILVFGPQIFFSYFTKNTIHNLPLWTYTENNNQSLLAAILRITHYNIAVKSPILNPIFIVSGFAVSVITFYIIYKINVAKEVWSLALLFSLMIFIYPGSQVVYGTILLPSIILLINKNELIPKGKIIIPFFIAIIYLIMLYASLYSYLFLWFIFLVICLDYLDFLPVRILNKNNFAGV